MQRACKLSLAFMLSACGASETGPNGQMASGGSTAVGTNGGAAGTNVGGAASGGAASGSAAAANGGSGVAGSSSSGGNVGVAGDGGETSFGGGPNPDPGDPCAEHVLEFTPVVSTGEGCDFQLNGTIDPDKVQTGSVSVNGQQVPYDATNGWQVVDGNIIHFVGSACDLVKSTGAVSINFPCGAVTFPQ